MIDWIYSLQVMPTEDGKYNFIRENFLHLTVNQAVCYWKTKQKPLPFKYLLSNWVIILKNKKSLFVHDQLHLLDIDTFENNTF